MRKLNQKLEKYECMTLVRLKIIKLRLKSWMRSPENPISPMEDRWSVPFMTRKSFIGFTIAAVSRRGFSLSGLSKISQRLQRESWGFRMCTANWMNGICGQNPRSKRMETRSWGFEDTFQEFGSRRVNILGIWMDTQEPQRQKWNLDRKFTPNLLFLACFPAYFTPKPSKFSPAAPRSPEILKSPGFFPKRL